MIDGVEVIRFLTANFGEVRSVKPNLWSVLHGEERQLFRVETGGMLTMRVDLDDHRCDWVETPGWVDHLVGDRVRVAEEFCTKGVM